MDKEYTCCIYRSKDLTKNFKIKVTLQRATGKSFMSDVDRERKAMHASTPLTGVVSDREEQQIGWQSKIFSKREYFKFTNPNFVPTTILEESYRDECLKLKERNYTPGRIFTYIDSDPYEFYDEIDVEVNSALKSDIPPFLEKIKTNLKKRKPLVGHVKNDHLKIPHKNIVNYGLNSEETRKFQSKIIPFHTMYIMADLSSSEGTHTLQDEKVLCCIKIDQNGAIIVKPDFSSSSYFIQTGGFAKETYEYFLEHVSSKIESDDLLREIRLHKELYQRHADYIKNIVGNEFRMPRIGVMKVTLYGEIRFAKNFDYDDLHVHYHLELPRNWHVDASVPLDGYTHTARTKSEGIDDVAYFSHPFEFDLYYKNDEINPKYKDELPKMPNIIFEVASYDSWSRYRTEGYTWTQIPNKPGAIEEELACWRPRGDSLIYEMRRFFIGGSPELENLTYVTIPQAHEGSILSRFGFRTVTTGSLTIRMNTVFQSQIFLNRKFKNKNEKTSLLDRIGAYNNLNDIIAVLDAFNVAKARMIEARESSKILLEE